MLALLIAAAVQTAAPPPADAEDKAVLATAQAFFDGFEKSDVAAMRATLLPNAQLMSLTSRPDGQTALRRFGFEETFGTKPPSGAKEWMWSPVIIRRGGLATVSAPYELSINGKSIHCGLDVFTLVKADGAWKIASISWTAEPDACPEIRKM
ncbi:nuclear transport factor 2 family protein [uncultured Caulobacter sp.]|uniref:nuclear transport factor 2 family protein n=1 Tax=uncultured Caulobacter sp. TaxID=158749 RepID=UPI00260862E9|nr:nuclear transport factor 2 family protein [uncultured Caulobacter sp.]